MTSARAVSGTFRRHAARGRLRHDDRVYEDRPVASINLPNLMTSSGAACDGGEEDRSATSV